MSENQITNRNNRLADDSLGDDIVLSESELESFRKSLPAVYTRFLPEVRRLRADQFAVDDPVRRILEEFLADQRDQGAGKPAE